MWFVDDFVDLVGDSVFVERDYEFFGMVWIVCLIIWFSVYVIWIFLILNLELILFVWLVIWLKCKWEILYEYC